MTIDLSKLTTPFPSEDVEWRVSRAGKGRKGIYCYALAYITARAIQARLDEVCGPDNWRNSPMHVMELRPGVVAMQVGISIRCGSDECEWITKYDVCEPTHIEAAKGGFSGAMKRAGAQWGIGRYLYHLSETLAEVSEEGGRGWIWARLPEKHGGDPYYWKPPSLPSWALPKDEYEITEAQLNELKRSWKVKFAPESNSPAELREGFRRFVTSLVGEFPLTDYTCWTADALEKCQLRVSETSATNGIDADVPFEE